MPFRAPIVVLCLLFTSASAEPGRLVFTEDLVVRDAGPDALIGRVAGLEIGRDGSIYAVDTGFGRVHVWADDGTHLRSFGQTGEGPGDIPPQIGTVGLDTTDPDRDLLVLGGNRSHLGWLDGEGDLIRSVDLGRIRFLRTVDVLNDGSIALTAVDFPWDADVVRPQLIHVHDTDGEPIASFGESSWWDPDAHERGWAHSLLIGAASVMPDGSTLAYVQGAPFELRLYEPDGTLLASTTDGLGDFVTEPRLPRVEGGTTHFTFIGNAGGPMIAPDGTIFVSAHVAHPDDRDRPWSEDDPWTWMRRVCAYDSDLDLIATGEGLDDVRPYALDREGRLWCVRTAEDPELVRMTVSIENE